MQALDNPNARQTLRMHTMDVHQRLERIPLFKLVLSGQASIQQYCRLLEAYRCFYSTAREALATGYRALASHGLADPEHDPMVLLEDDLHAVSAHAHAVPANTTVLEIATALGAAEGVGWVWVSEGSALGAKVIDRSLNTLFGDARSGRTFFEPPPRAAARWRNVCNSMECFAKQPQVLPSMTRGAEMAFELMEQSLLGAKA